MARYGSYSKQAVSIVFDGTTESYKFNFPFHKQLIEIIKSTVPANMRSYDEADNHAWYISVTGGNDKYADGLTALLHATFPNATFFEYTRAKYEEQNRFSAAATKPDAEKTLSELQKYAQQDGFVLSRESSFNDAQKIYRKLAIRWHPDKNPANGPVMSTINAAWATLKEQKFFKEG